MAKKPYTNNTDGIKHVGPVTLQPGETREVEEMHLKGHGLDTGSGEAESAEPAVSIIAQILADKIPAIKKQLPDLTMECIDQMEEAEKASEKPRAGLLSAISEERLRRAAAADEEKEAELQNFIKSLDGLSDDELIAEGARFTGDESKAAYLDAVNAEMAARSGGTEMQQFIDSLSDMSDAELAENKELYTGEPDQVAYLDAVNTEIEKRAAE